MRRDPIGRLIDGAWWLVVVTVLVLVVFGWSDGPVRYRLRCDAVRGLHFLREVIPEGEIEPGGAPVSRPGEPPE